MLTVGSRLFLRKLRDTLQIPVLALVDSDPYGLKILSVYMKGELCLSPDLHCRSFRLDPSGSACMHACKSGLPVLTEVNLNPSPSAECVPPCLRAGHRTESMLQAA